MAKMVKIHPVTMDNITKKDQNKGDKMQNVDNKTKEPKNFIVNFHYPCIYSYNVKSTNPADAIRLAEKANNNNIDGYTNEYVEERPEKGEIDFENKPEILIYDSEKNYYIRPMLSLTPDKKTLEESLERIIKMIQNQYDTHDQLAILYEQAGLDKELLKYFGYTEEDFNEFKESN